MHMVYMVHLVSKSATSGQLESVLRKLAEPAMRKQDQADMEARPTKELNAILRNLNPRGDDMNVHVMLHVAACAYNVHI